jgi:hypothetical protein
VARRLRRVKKKNPILPTPYQTILRMCEQRLYHKSELSHKEILAEIVRENRLVQESQSDVFTYKGEIYSPANDTSGRISLLHLSLQNRMEEWLQLVKDIKTEKDLVLGFLKSVMALTNRAADWYRLMPKPLHGILRDVEMALDPGENTLNDEQVAAFLQDNAKYIHLMKIRLTHNLLNVTT